MSHVQKKLKHFSEKYTYKIRLSLSGYYMITQESHGTRMWPFRIVYIVNSSATLLCFFLFLKFFCVVCSKIDNFLSTSPSKSRIKEAIA